MIELTFTDFEAMPFRAFEDAYIILGHEDPEFVEYVKKIGKELNISTQPRENFPKTIQVSDEDFRHWDTMADALDNGEFLRILIGKWFGWNRPMSNWWDEKMALSLKLRYIKESRGKGRGLSREAYSYYKEAKG